MVILNKENELLRILIIVPIDRITLKTIRIFICLKAYPPLEIFIPTLGKSMMVRFTTIERTDTYSILIFKYRPKNRYLRVGRTSQQHTNPRINRNNNYLSTATTSSRFISSVRKTVSFLRRSNCSRTFPCSSEHHRVRLYFHILQYPNQLPPP